MTSTIGKDRQGGWGCQGGGLKIFRGHLIEKVTRVKLKRGEEILHQELQAPTM